MTDYWWWRNQFLAARGPGVAKAAFVLGQHVHMYAARTSEYNPADNRSSPAHQWSPDFSLRARHLPSLSKTRLRVGERLNLPRLTK